MNYTEIPNKEKIEKTIEALKQNGMNALLVEKEDAKETVLEMLTDGAEVMNMTSVTLEELGIAEAINTSGKYKATRKSLWDESVPEMEKKRLGAAPEFTLGSVHAVTENGEVIIASNSGSQLPSFAYGARKVIWVVGVQKIVSNLDEGMKRLYEHVLPLESVRANKAYGVPGSFVSKILIVNREATPDRITVVFVNDNIGY